MDLKVICRILCNTKWSRGIAIAGRCEVACLLIITNAKTQRSLRHQKSRDNSGSCRVLSKTDDASPAHTHLRRCIPQGKSEPDERGAADNTPIRQTDLRSSYLRTEAAR